MNFTKQIKSTIKKYVFERADEYHAFVIGFLSSTGNICGDFCCGEFSEKDDFIIKMGEELNNYDFHFAPSTDDLNYHEMCYEGNFDIANFLVEGDLSVKKAYLRGAFLAVGSILDPKKGYHFELSMADAKEAERLRDILFSMGIKSKIIKRESNHVVYVKDGEEISDILTFLGAISETLYFEEQMVVKSARNDINRRVNCETANLSKTISAGVKQIAAIEKLRESGKLEVLDEELYEVAILRLANPDATLKELAMLFGKGISKSGINYRLKKLIELAED